MFKQRIASWNELRASDESEQWHKYIEKPSADARAELIEIYTPFARMLAAKLFAKRHVEEAEFGDYLHYALIGLLEAIDRYEPQRGIPFTAFAAHRIKGTVLNHVPSLSEKSQQIALRARMRRDRTASLASGLPPSDSVPELFELLSATAIGLAIGFLLEGTGMVLMSEAEQSAAQNPYASLQRKDESKLLEALVDLLDGKERMVLRYHYFFGFAFEEIAQEMKLSKGRISQLHRKGLDLLRDLYRRAHQLDLRL